MQPTIINYDLLKKRKPIVITSLLMVIIYNGIYYFNAANHRWFYSPNFSVLNTLYYILIDQALIECITISLVFFGIGLYAKKFKLNVIKHSFKNKMRYLLKFLPLFFIVYFIYSPFTLFARFLFNNYALLDFSIYMNEYFFWNAHLYITYFFPVLLSGYGILIFNLYNQQKTEFINDSDILNNATHTSILLLKTQQGEVPIGVDDILWIRKTDRKYELKDTKGKIYTTSFPLNKLEELFPPEDFIRANRMVILAISNIQSYSFWENEKYILRSKDGETFIVSRERIKNIKLRLST